MRNSDAVSVRKITGDFVRALDEPTALGLLQRWLCERDLGHGMQQEHGTALIFLTELINQFRARSLEIEPAHLQLLLGRRIEFHQPDQLRAVGTEIRTLALVHELGF